MKSILKPRKVKKIKLSVAEIIKILNKYCNTNINLRSVSAYIEKNVDYGTRSTIEISWFEKDQIDKSRVIKEKLIKVEDGKAITYIK